MTTESGDVSWNAGHESNLETRDQDKKSLYQDQPMRNELGSEAPNSFHPGSKTGMTSKSYATSSDSGFADTEGWLSHTMDTDVPTSSPLPPISPSITFDQDHARSMTDSANDTKVSLSPIPDVTGQDTKSEKADNEDTIELPPNSLNPLSGDSVDLELQEKGFQEHALAPKSIAAIDTTWLQRSGHETAMNYNDGWYDTPSRRSSDSGTKTLGHKLFDEFQTEEEEHAITSTDTQAQAQCYILKNSAQKHSVASITNGVADSDLIDSLSAVTPNVFSSQNPVSVHLKEVKPQPLQTVVSSTPSMASEVVSTSNVDAGHGASRAFHEEDHSQELQAASAPKNPNEQARFNNKPHNSIGQTPNLSNPATVSTMCDFIGTETQAESDLISSSNSSTKRPRGFSMLEISPYKLCEVHLDSEAQNKNKALDSIIHEEYEDMINDVRTHLMAHCHEGDKAIVPTYRYPGTYEAAKHDTYEAAKNVGSAALSFGGALVSSGIGKAAWSVGALSLNAGRRAGKHVATQAILKSGYKNSLPTGVQNWADANEQKRLSKVEAKKHHYQLAHQGGQRLANPRAPVVAYSTEEDTKKIVREESMDEADSNLNTPERDSEDEWVMVNLKGIAGSGVQGQHPVIKTMGAPHGSTIN